MGLRTMLGLKRRKTLRLKSKANSVALAEALLADARPYHPLGDYVPASLKRPDKAFHERWKYVSAALEKFKVESFCDLGCAEGYYVRGAAREHGIFAVGIDNDPQRLRWATAVSALDDDWSCGFLCIDLTSQNVRNLPTFDAIACMSLMHHVIHHRGFDEARAMLTEIARKTRKCMIFDMGGPDEIENDWAASLSMLTGDVDRNITAMLAECGFMKITAVGRSAGYNSAAERTMFVAEPSSS